VQALLAAHSGADPAEPWLERLTEVGARVQRAWPELDADLTDFFGHVGRVLARQGLAAGAVVELEAEDLYLAYAAARGCRQALVTFEREVGRELRFALLKFRIPTERHDDVRQDLWEKLFVRSDPPKILEYTGRGRLRTWFRVIAVRLLLDDARRSRKGEVVDEPPDELKAPLADPELEVLRATYSHQFGAAFEQAIALLTAEQRNTLRSYYAKELTIDEIATAYGIHRATAARRVNQARDALLTATRRLLAERLRLDTAGLDSVLRLLTSQLHLSVRRLLG